MIDRFTLSNSDFSVHAIRCGTRFEVRVEIDDRALGMCLSHDEAALFLRGFEQLLNWNKLDA